MLMQGRLITSTCSHPPPPACKRTTPRPKAPKPPTMLKPLCSSMEALSGDRLDAMFTSCCDTSRTRAAAPPPPLRSSAASAASSSTSSASSESSSPAGSMRLLPLVLAALLGRATELAAEEAKGLRASVAKGLMVLVAPPLPLPPPNQPLRATLAGAAG